MGYTESELNGLRKAEVESLLRKAPFRLSNDEVGELKLKKDMVAKLLELQESMAKTPSQGTSRGRASSASSTPAARGRSTSRKAPSSAAGAASGARAPSVSRGRSGGRGSLTVKAIKEKLEALGVTDFRGTLKAQLQAQLAEVEAAAEREAAAVARRATPRTPVFSSARRLHATHSSPEPVSTPLSFSPAATPTTTPRARGRSPGRTPLPAYSPRLPSPPRTSPSPAPARPQQAYHDEPPTYLPSPWFALAAAAVGVAVYLYVWLTTPHDPKFLAAELASAAVTAGSIALARVQCGLAVNDELQLDRYQGWAPAWLARDVARNNFPNEIVELARRSLQDSPDVVFADVPGTLRFTATTPTFPITDVDLTLCWSRRAAWAAITASPATAASIVVVALLALAVALRRRAAAAHVARVDSLTRQLLSLLQRQAAIAESSPTTQPWILASHARDLLCPTDSSHRSSNVRAWAEVEQNVDRSSLVTVQPRLVDGCQQDVWQWIGPPAATA
mmetsp:Transcript_15794/g.49420  ORF Transcript_15794/g.49420 Transcript_15794/m.49420 type:complete len:505 (-) Transcript_15794:316-1830(-)